MRRIAAVLIAVICAPVLIAQEPAPAFEVASVKQNNSGDTFAYGGVTPSLRLSLTNYELRHIISQAFRIHPQLARFTMIGGPDRIMTSRFDIQAKAPDGASPNDIYAMVRTLS